VFSKGKIDVEVLLKILLLTAFLFIAVIILLALFNADRLNEHTISDLGCKWTNALKSEADAFSLVIPRLCVFTEIEDPQDNKDISSLLRTTWSMYGQGKWSFGTEFDEIEPVFVFYVTEDTSVQDLIQYMLTHKRDKEISIQANSDYNFVQEGGLAQTLCFDPDTFGEDYSTAMLNDGVPYFIIFYDDQGLLTDNVGDKILISKDPQFDPLHWRDLLKAFILSPSTIKEEKELGGFKQCLEIPVQ